MSEGIVPKMICEGLLAVELGGGKAASVVSMVLADNGARVFKIEPPGGDPLRQENPTGSLVWNRGKESVILDLERAGDRERARQLITQADILVESLQPQTAEEYGLTFDALHALNPALVHCSITAFGPVKEYAHLKADEGVVQTKAAAVAPAGTRPGPGLYDGLYAAHGAAHTALQGIAAALIAREETGRGQHVETSLLQGLYPYDLWSLPAVQVKLQQPDMLASARAGVSWGGSLCSKDGRWVSVNSVLPHQSVALARALGFRYEEEPRFKDFPDIRDPATVELVRETLFNLFYQRTMDEWLPDLLAQNDLPFEVVGTSEQALEHPQLIHNRQWITIDDPTVGPMRQVGPVAAYSGSPSVIRKPAPAPGAHDVLPTERALPEDTGRPTPRYPLEGITIVEAGFFYAVPHGIKMLADLGARVIKVEPPAGDPFRLSGGGAIPGCGPCNTMRGKESLAIDLMSPEGQEVIHKLVAKADAFVFGLRNSAAVRMKVDPETLRQINPRLIYHHGAGYGATGPYADRPMYGGTGAAAAGWTGRQAGFWLNPDLYTDTDLPDVMEHARHIRGVNGDPVAAFVVGSALALALYHQKRTGEGQHMLTTHVGANTYALLDDFTKYEHKVRVPGMDPEMFGHHALYRFYNTARGWVFLSCTTEVEWQAFCAATGQEALILDVRFATAEARKEHDAALIDHLEGVFVQRTAADWEALLTACGVACVELVQGEMEIGLEGFAERMLTDPALSTQLVEVNTSAWGRMKVHRPAISFSETSTRTSDSCGIGEHTDAILAELGYSSDEIEALTDKKVVVSNGVAGVRVAARTG